ncbi:hypothetical protein Bca101_009842 [Brassica carinata]
MAVEKYGPHVPTTLDEPFGTSRYTLEVKGMIEAVKDPKKPKYVFFYLCFCSVVPLYNIRFTSSAGNKDGESSSEDVEVSPESVAEAKMPVPQGRVLRSMSIVQSPGIDVRPLTIALLSGEKRAAPTSSGKPIGGDLQGSEASSAAHKSKKRRLSIIPSASSSSSDREIPPLDIPIFEDPENLALVWRKIRAKDCDLPDLDKMSERGAYIRMATANAKAMEASNEYAALMEACISAFPDKEDIAGHMLTIQRLRADLEAAQTEGQKSTREVAVLMEKLAVAEQKRLEAQSDVEAMNMKCKRALEGRDAAVRRGSRRACQLLTEKHGEILKKMKEKWKNKKIEVAAEIALERVRAKINVLSEYLDGGFELEEKLAQL